MTQACRYDIPVSPGNNVALTGNFPLSSREWEQLIVVLEAMRPGLVGPELAVGLADSELAALRTAREGAGGPS